MKVLLKKYVKERNEMLKKCDVNELRKFVNDHKGFFNAEYLTRFNATSDELLTIALHKMIVNEPKLPQELRDKSALWLIERGLSLTIR